MRSKLNPRRRAITTHTLTPAVKRSVERKGRTTRLAVQAVQLKGWLTVTEEEKCDRKLAIPFN
jgi:hypothetical protein